jgi:hypothetical protein
MSYRIKMDISVSKEKTEPVSTRIRKAWISFKEPVHILPIVTESSYKEKVIMDSSETTFEDFKAHAESAAEEGASSIGVAAEPTESAAMRAWRKITSGLFDLVTKAVGGMTIIGIGVGAAALAQAIASWLLPRLPFAMLATPNGQLLLSVAVFAAIGWLLWQLCLWSADMLSSGKIVTT